MALRGAFAAAQQIVHGSSGLPHPSVVLEAGRIHVSWQPDGLSRHMTSMAVEAAQQCFLLATPGSISISPTADTILAAFARRTKPGVDQGEGRLRRASEPAKSTRASISETIDLLASDPVCGQLIPSTRAQIAHASGGLTDLAREIARLIASGAVPADATRQDDERTSAVSVLAFCRLDASGKFKPFLRAAALFGDAIDAEILAAALSLDKATVTPLFDWAIEFGLMEPLAQPIDGRHRIRSRSARLYRFTSPLLRETAYRSIPARMRRQLHAQIATAMQDHHAMGADVDLATIADQFARAERNEDAIRWWRRAAEAAITSSASRTAVSHLEIALAHVTTAPNIATDEAIADLTRLYGPQLSAVKGNASSEVLTVYEQRSIADGLANSAHLPHQFDSLWGIQTCFLVRGELDKACQNSAQLMACTFAIGTTEHRILALRLHALLEFLLGNLDRARDHYLSVLSLLDPTTTPLCDTHTHLIGPPLPTPTCHGLTPFSTITLRPRLPPKRPWCAPSTWTKHTPLTTPCACLRQLT